MHLKVTVNVDDEEDCAIEIDFRYANLPLKYLLTSHGDCDQHVNFLFPSFSGSVEEKITEYFKQVEIECLPLRYEKVHSMSGDARKDALREDIRPLRAL